MKTFWCLVILTCALVNSSANKSYSGLYVVKLAKDTPDVGLLANKHGLVNLGQTVDGVFAFKDTSSEYASSKPNQKLLESLRADPRILTANQELTLSRHRRSEDVVIKDPLFVEGYQDWYYSQMQIIGAWSKCLSGKGIIVAVVDSGVQGKHPDLRENYDFSLDYDVQRNIDDASPESEDEVHGTNSAGIIAAGRNSKCGIGIAYGATITGVRLFGANPLTDSYESRALKHRLDVVDIYSNSWGPPGNAQSIDGFGPLARKSVTEGIIKGRGGKGSIYVFSAGNGGIFQDSCAYDGYVNDIRIIAVTAIGRDGSLLRSSERCSAILVSAFSRSKYDKDNIITTTKSNSCTGKYGRSSAAAPQISAIIALALEANPSLTWRDVQHLLVRSSEHDKHVQFWKEKTVKNGAGLVVSSAFGFGIVNADSMVKLASSWKNVPEMKTCQMSMLKTGVGRLPGEFTRYVSSDDCGSIRSIEHVELTIDATYCLRGYLTATVTSPSKTESVMLPGRLEDTRSTILRWTVDSVHFWGENPIGSWTIKIEPLEGGKITCPGSGVAKDLKLTFHGTSTKPDLSRTPSLTRKCRIFRAKRLSYAQTDHGVDDVIRRTPSEARMSKYQEMSLAIRRLEELVKIWRRERNGGSDDVHHRRLPSSTSSYSVTTPGSKTRTSECTDEFDRPIRGRLLKVGDESSQRILGVTSVQTCKDLCVKDDECRSITYISELSSRKKSGRWELFGIKCYLNLVKASDSLLIRIPDFLRGDFYIHNRIC